jgi:hypothetical protein
MLKRVAFVFLAVLALGLGGQAPQTLYVAPLARDGELLVSFRLAQTLTPELQKAIHSGLPVRFVYKVDLKRSSLGWIDRTIASAEVSASVRFDNLTRRYHLSREIDGRIDDTVDPTDSEEVAWAWVTTQFNKMPLFRGTRLEPNAEYYVRVRAHTTAPPNSSFVLPWRGNDVVGFAKFTFIR